MRTRGTDWDVFNAENTMKLITFTSMTAALALCLAGCHSDSGSAKAPGGTENQPTVAENTPPSKVESTAPDSTTTKPDATTPSAPNDSGTKKPLDEVVPPGMKKEADKLRNAPVPLPHQENWTTSDLEPQQIADAADRAIANLSGAYAEASIHLKNPEGAGQTLTRLEVQDPAHYNVQYIDVTEGAPRSVIQRANGTEKRTLLAPNYNKQNQWQPPRPVSAKGTVPTGQALVEQFPTQFPRLGLAPLLECRPVFGAYVKALRSSDYTMKSEKRTLNYQGHIITSYRIIAEHKANTGKLGAARIEMVFDAGYHLPVTISTRVKPGGKPIEMLWSSNWAFRQNFNPKEFAIPQI